MNQRESGNTSGSERADKSYVWLGLVAVVLFFAASGVVSWLNTRLLDENTQQVTRTHDVIATLTVTMSTVKDAETGQRGYLLTRDSAYLAPYDTATIEINRNLSDLQTFTADDPEQRKNTATVTELVQRKFGELKDSIEVARTRGFDAAMALVKTNQGKNDMDQLRSLAATMRQREQQKRQLRIAEMKGAYRTAVISGITAALLGIVLSLSIGMLIRKDLIARRRQAWLQAGRVGLGAAMMGDQGIDQLGENVLKFLAQYFGSQAGVFYAGGEGEFHQVASYGLPAGAAVAQRFTMGDGLLGQAAKDGRPFIVDDVPDGYLVIGSALGSDRPRHLLVAPAKTEGIVNAVLELGFFHPLNQDSVELLEILAEAIGVAVRSANDRTKLQNLLEETQRQAEELQAQSEELRVSNEELEEQGRALKESQTRLEQQQAELEQTNSQLEEQAQQLEVQKNDLERAALQLEDRANEVQRASQYKSDFLANMSHELRTPLNSSLILAKLLADNAEGNLSVEQVKFAKTIENSGNTLLALINDILDLSKIEAGHMQIQVEPLSLDRLVGDMVRTFEPLAKEKGLVFETSVSPLEKTFESDRQRLEQILRNLVSNAIKFTEKGSVALRITGSATGVNFSVQDSGIGIPEDQQKEIFDAFRQADGTISRRYGGTGLGLSISRQLAKLLGGVVTLESETGKGSTFTLQLPFKPEAGPAERPAVEPVTAPPARPTSQAVAEKPLAPRIGTMADDRDQLRPDMRTILVIEDDESFASILYDLVHEMNFQCLLASTAEEALILSRQHIPDAVVLDVGLPDNSGLSVLDRLKQNPRTRHIPVHVVSAGDYTETAYSLGAVGYMIKPVKREELIEALQNLESRFAQRMRRVLIVEDDFVQRESVGKLLGSNEVQTVGVGTAAECLEKLKESTFDCMVLDLTLPDASGYSLLETLSQEDAYSFPPVIVYTGRELSADEEQRLRRYSKSIIIKGAKSPERLLDEVTLFLHKVVSDLPAEQQRLLEKARNRDAVLEGRRILVVEDDVANVYALTSIFEPRGAEILIARNGREAIEALEEAEKKGEPVELVLMDVMMPEVDGLTATRQIRKRSEWTKLPIIMLTAKAMRDDQERCLDAGANDYMAKPLDVEKLLSLVRVWMPR